MNSIDYQTTGFAVGLFCAMVLMVEWGRRIGVRHRRRLAEGASAGLGAVDAAVFGLLGLLVAFTFQGAASRFDARRELIVQEANAIGTAWLRIDLLSPELRPAMRERFRQYLDSRLAVYRKVPDMDAVAAELRRGQDLQSEIWQAAIAAQEVGSHGQRVTVGFLPALNPMFDLVTTRTMAAGMHPPTVVFGMLGLVACAAALLAGHGMSGSPLRSWIHIVGFAAILALTVYVIMDLEFPRLGLIRVDAFDQVLVDLRQSMR